MAKADGFNTGVALHISGKNCHRIRVVKEYCIRAVFFYIATNIKHKGNITKSTENSAHASRIINIDINAILLRNKYFVLPYVNVSVKHGAKNRVSTLKSLCSIHSGSYAAGIRNTHFIDYFFNNLCDVFKIALVDIHKRELAFLECGKGKKVTNTAAGKLQTTRTDKSKLLHSEASLSFIAYILARGTAAVYIITCKKYGENCYLQIKYFMIYYCWR